MAYKSSFSGMFAAREDTQSGEGSSSGSSYRSSFSGMFSTRRKREEEKKAEQSYAEELRKEQQQQAEKEQKDKGDDKNLLQKTGDFLHGAFVEPTKNAYEGIKEVTEGQFAANDLEKVTEERNAMNKRHNAEMNAILGDKDSADQLDAAGKKKWDEYVKRSNKERDEFDARTKGTTEKANKEIKESSDVDARKTAVGAAETFLNVATLGVGTGVKAGVKAGAKEVIEQGVKAGTKQAGKTAFKTATGAGAKGLAGQAGKDAIIGGSFGVLNALEDEDSGLDDYAKNILFGAAIGAAAPVALKGAGKLAKGADKAAGRATQKAIQTENQAMQRSLQQIGEDGIIGTLDKAVSRGIKRGGYAVEDALGKTKAGAKVVSMKDDFMSKWVSEFHPLYKTLKRSDFEGKTEGAYLAAREAIGNSNRALSYAQDFIENDPSMQKITASIAARDKNLVKARADFDEFVKVKSDLDLQAAGKKQFTPKRTAELNERMAKFKDQGYDQEYGDLVQFYKDLNKFRVDNGLMSKEMADQFEKEGFDYVRQQRELPDWMLEKPAGKGRGSAASVTKSEAVQSRNKFASAEQLSPLETAIKTAQMAHVEAYRNQAAKRVYGLLDEAGEAKLLKTTDMVREKQALLTGMKEGKKVATKINRAIRVNKNQVRDLKKEIQWLQKNGQVELKKNIRNVKKDLNTKSAAGSGKEVLSERQMMDYLVSLDTKELRSIRRKIEGRNAKLEPLMDRIESLNGELADVQAMRSGVYQQAQSINTTVNKGSQTTMSFLDDGVENVAKIDPAIASAVHNWDKQSQNVMNEVLRFSNNVFKYGTTGANVGFALPNFVADQVGSAINSKSLLSTHNPINFTHSLFMAMGKPLNARDSEILRGYLRGNKGQTSINQYTKQATADKAANKLVRKGAKWTDKTYTVIRNPKEAMRTLFDSTEGLVALTENVTRIQNYRGITNAAEKAGRSAGDVTRLANQAARENSVDFLEAGSYGRVINSLIPYFNAAIQGNRVMLRNAVERPVSFSGKVTALVGAPIAATTIWNTSDPDRKAIYDTIPDYIKDTNFVVITPGAKWNEETKKWDGVVMMKKPPGFKEFAEPVRKFIEYKADDPNADLGSFLRDEGGSIAADFGSALQPIDFSSPNKFLSSVTPQLLKPTAEAILNKNFFQGEDIVGDWMSDREPADQKYENYSALTSHIGAMFNTSPLKVDHWIRQTFGEVGTNAQYYIDRGIQGATDGPDEAVGGRSLPESISRRFGSPSGGADQDAFYDSYNTASSARKRASSQVTELVKAGRINEAKRRAEEYNESIKDRFSGFMKKYSDSPNYDPEWDTRIDELRIPTTEQAFKARKRQD